jgi:hypothetical protein
MNKNVIFKILGVTLVFCFFCDSFFAGMQRRTEQEVEADQPEINSIFAVNKRTNKNVEVFFDAAKKRIVKVTDLKISDFRKRTALRAKGLSGKKKKEKHIVYPENLRVHLCVSKKPIHNNFTRFVTFRNKIGGVKRIAVAFTPYSMYRTGIWYEGNTTEEGKAVFHSLANTGNRWYWDSMLLENRGGTTSLDIHSLKMWIEYDLSSAFKEKIEFINSHIGKVLKAGNSALNLDSAAKKGRNTFAGYNPGQYIMLPKPLRLAIQDLGKSGSDGPNPGELHPKYNNATSYLCSEFVSWYYYEGGVKIKIAPILEFNFRNVTGTNEMHTAFKLAGKLYSYDKVSKRFKNTKTGNVYYPKPGDFLERRGNDGKAEHSMIMKKWDQANGIAYVINGPWPVTIREVYVQSIEEKGENDFYVGRIK